MSARIRIAVDAMSGDLGPRVAIAAAESFAALYSDVELILVGDQCQLQPLMAKSRHLRTDQIRHASDVVSMADDPLVSLRQKKN